VELSYRYSASGEKNFEKMRFVLKRGRKIADSEKGR
jgi:hypothetical protein